MRKFLFILLAVMTLLACNNANTGKTGGEPGAIFYTEYDTPFGMPPFDRISFEDYKPAFLKGMEEEAKEIEAIANNSETPTFENTIVAMENSGRILTRVSRVFYGLRSAETNDSIQALAVELSPLLSEHRDNINLNEKLFNRIKTLHDDTTGMNLDTEQYTGYWTITIKIFVRSGILLSETEKSRLREINKELSSLHPCIRK
jgi:peptidyl-dipeptidase Dcp